MKLNEIKQPISVKNLKKKNFNFKCLKVSLFAIYSEIPI